VFHEPQPGFLEQVLGDVAAAGQPHQERQQTCVERRVDLVERVGVSLSKPLDQHQLAFVPFVMAVVYLIRPTERHLALMRPLSLAGLFAAIAGAVLGFINVLSVAWTRELTAETYRVMAVGAAESLVTVFVCFASLAAAWLLVAVGMTRRREP
jgi:hypothetical protein